MRPATALLQPCAEPAPPTDHTLGGLVQSVHDYQTALDFCNAQLDALRAFFK
ncbi:Rz1-like lysis system protein LysC [Burkholderia cenocepacia]